MTEYKVGYLSFFNHLPVLVLEGLLIYGATFVDFYEWIWIMITCAILGITIIAISISVNKIFGISKHVLSVRVGQKKSEYLLSNIKTIRKRKWNVEIGFRDSGKVKTIYFGWYIRKYRKMRDQLFEYIEQLDNYDRIIFIK